MHRSRSHDAVIHVYDAGDVIKTHEHGRVQRAHEQKSGEYRFIATLTNERTRSQTKVTSNILRALKSGA
jgi:hypothetical protein